MKSTQRLLCTHFTVCKSPPGPLAFLVFPTPTRSRYCPPIFQQGTNLSKVSQHVMIEPGLEPGSPTSRFRLIPEVEGTPTHGKPNLGPNFASEPPAPTRTVASKPWSCAGPGPSSPLYFLKGKPLVARGWVRGQAASTGGG